MNTKKNITDRILHWIALLPLMLLLGIVPSLVRLYMLRDPLSSFAWTGNAVEEFDLYLLSF